MTQLQLKKLPLRKIADEFEEVIDQYCPHSPRKKIRVDSKDTLFVINALCECIEFKEDYLYIRFKKKYDREYSINDGFIGVGNEHTTGDDTLCVDSGTDYSWLDNMNSNGTLSGFITELAHINWE